ncbi:MAG: hypothetical protein MZV70_58970 [Desulfobacterales bacterium]|nr:hypothetical protein [Desulfobacterales bacterium]
MRCGDYRQQRESGFLIYLPFFGVAPPSLVLKQATALLEHCVIEFRFKAGDKKEVKGVGKVLPWQHPHHHPA